MEFKTLNFKQPVVGDPRCALYAMANLFNERAFLLMSKPGEMTDHEQELHLVQAWAAAKEAAGERCLVNYIEFHAGIFGHGRIHLEDLNFKGTGSGEVYVAGLIDYRIPGKDYAHTVGFLWPEGERFIELNPQKNEPKELPKESFFKLLEVVGFRVFAQVLKNGNGKPLPVYFTRDAFPHIFHNTGQEVKQQACNCTNMPCHAS